MQNMSAYQALGGASVEFDTRKFFWIGNTTDTPNVINSWHTTGIKTIQDVMTRELVVGAPGTATSSVYYPKALNELVGTKFKIVSGYPGGNDVNLAMERGEVGGRGSNSWASWKSTHPQWLAEKKIFILVQIALQARSRAGRRADHDRARQERRRPAGAGVPLGRHPDQPRLCHHARHAADRVQALRRAFDATMKDPAFLAEAAKTDMDISASTGEEAQKFADMIANTPPAVIARAR